mmetsp:Transcript_58839/g.161458  ORF Transcript_58839/g.161458 Transcript_58839/m.161458 type:complete len:227 (-) Transcript_58839:17-697(-)
MRSAAGVQPSGSSAYGGAERSAGCSLSSPPQRLQPSGALRAARRRRGRCRSARGAACPSCRPTGRWRSAAVRRSTTTAPTGCGCARCAPSTCTRRCSARPTGRRRRTCGGRATRWRATLCSTWSRASCGREGRLRHARRRRPARRRCGRRREFSRLHSPWRRAQEPRTRYRRTDGQYLSSQNASTGVPGLRELVTHIDHRIHTAYHTRSAHTRGSGEHTRFSCVPV